jgi:CRISPR-associated protein Csy2
MTDASKRLLLLPRIRVQNCNAISSPITWGFPAPSAFVGFAHALCLKLSDAIGQSQSMGVGIACHHFETQTSGNFEQSPHLTRNPLVHNKKTGNWSAPAFNEEVRGHMDVSLLIKLSVPKDASDESVRTNAIEQTLGMRLAGGSVLKLAQDQVQLWSLNDADLDQQITKQVARVLPRSRILVERSDLLMRQQKNQPAGDLLDTFLDLNAVHFSVVAKKAQSDATDAAPEQEAPAGKSPKVKWEASRRVSDAWIVPVPLGYAAISDLYEKGSVKNARDKSKDFRFVESVVGLGEWISPYRLQHFEHMLWQFDANPEAGSYRIRNGYQPKQLLSEKTTIN